MLYIQKLIFLANIVDVDRYVSILGFYYNSDRFSLATSVCFFLTTAGIMDSPKSIYLILLKTSPSSLPRFLTDVAGLTAISYFVEQN